MDECFVALNLESRLAVGDYGDRQDKENSGWSSDTISGTA